MILMLFLITLPMFSNMSPVYSKGNTYYIDNVAGDDGNNGMSISTPWKTLDKVNSVVFEPGDKILFRRGGSWSGQLRPQGSGTDGSPIILDAYGQGDKPRIIGVNLGTKDIDDPSKAHRVGAVYLYNQDYWVIRNLDVTNTGNPHEVWRAGIFYRAEDGRKHEYIHIEDCDVHDVMGFQSQSASYQLWNDSAGILIQIGNADTGGKRTYLNDILIERCTSSNNYSKGIVTDEWAWKAPARVPNENGDNRWYAFTNLVVRNNVMDGNQGDGMIIYNAESPVIEYNIASSNHLYSGNVFCVGMWTCMSSKAVFQYNEVYGTLTNLDGQAFDIDWETKDCVFQYNYSHDNVGGMLLVCNEGGRYNQRGIARYNISQNDGSSSNQLIRINGKSEACQIYNNTFYVGSDRKPSLIYAQYKDGFASGISFLNNIFFTEETPGEWKDVSKLENAVFSNNLIYAATGEHAAGEPEDPFKVVSDPLFVLKGSGGNGISTVDGYMLRTNSPAIGKGAVVRNNGGRDYWGNPVAAEERPNIGAYNGKGVDSPPKPDKQPPTIPTGVAATASSATEIDLFWYPSTDPSEVAGYKIFRNGIPIGSTAVPEFKDTDLSPGTEYTYTVTAFDSKNNESAHSTPPKVVTTKDSEADPIGEVILEPPAEVQASNAEVSVQRTPYLKYAGIAIALIFVLVLLTIAGTYIFRKKRK